MKLSRQLALAFIRAKYQVLSVISPEKAAEQAFLLFSTPKKNKTPVITIQPTSVDAVVSNHFRLRIYRWGSSAKKVLIIHGFESCAAKFESYVEPLLDKGYEVVAFDAQAHGASEGKFITLPEYVSNIRDVYQAFGPFEAFISHSLGASALSHFLESLPQNVAPKSVLIAPSTEASSILNRFYNIIKLRKASREYFEVITQKRAGQQISYFSVIRALGNIQSKILWLHDKDDKITPFADAEKVQSFNFQHVEFVPTEGLGHNYIYKDKGVQQKIITFL